MIIDLKRISNKALAAVFSLSMALSPAAAHTLDDVTLEDLKTASVPIFPSSSATTRFPEESSWRQKRLEMLEKEPRKEEHRFGNGAFLSALFYQTGNQIWTMESGIDQRTFYSYCSKIISYDNLMFYFVATSILTAVMLNIIPVARDAENFINDQNFDDPIEDRLMIALANGAAIAAIRLRRHMRFWIPVLSISL